jgi:hypothetical protein
MMETAALLINQYGRVVSDELISYYRERKATSRLANNHPPSPSPELLCREVGVALAPGSTS